MIAEIIPTSYDAEGKKVFSPFDRRKGPHPTFPMGRYVSHPLTVQCSSMEDVRQFLTGCKGVSDKEQFDRDDYWQPPENFEKTRKGDCDDFALWTWRQLLSMGYEARFIVGPSGRYGQGHAWVEFFEDGSCYLLEPQLCFLGPQMPRISTLKYHPRFSVAWDGEKLSYYEHNERPARLSFPDLVRLLPEYILIWGRFWLKSPIRVPWFIWHTLKRFFIGFRWMRKTRGM